MQPFDTGGSRAWSVTWTYPLAAMVTASTDRWDAGVALVNSSPARISVPGVTASPRATPVVEAGAGVTPTVGLRLGVSFARGAYLTSDELSATAPPGDRTMTLVVFEGEYAVRYTKIAGEVIHDAFTNPVGDVGATLWFVQATQAITPRWFVAGRHEGTASGVISRNAAFVAQPRLMANELATGFRVTRDVTLKASYYARQPYGRTDWDHQWAAQSIWDHRWW